MSSFAYNLRLSSNGGSLGGDSVRIRNATELGAVIRDRRNELGWTQTDLARHCGAARSWVAAVEAGKPGAEFGLVLRALSSMGMDLDAVASHRPAASDLDSYLEGFEERP
jgi:HTH-type transcriptional regulator/antitoxin HipB